jgi:cytochrome bd-type quinol oxidase subunit 2
MQHLRSVYKVPRGAVARLDMYLYLLQPVFAGVVGVAMLAALSAFVFRGVAITPSSVLWVVVFFFLGFGGVSLGCVARRGRGPAAWVSGFTVGTIYAAYTWLLWPALVRATLRLITARSTWAKTEREALEEPG